MRRGRPGLIGMAARTAVIAGTATAVSGAVAGHQADKRQTQAEADAYEQQQMAAQMAAQAAPPPRRAGSGRADGQAGAAREPARAGHPERRGVRLRQGEGARTLSRDQRCAGRSDPSIARRTSVMSRPMSAMRASTPCRSDWSRSSPTSIVEAGATWIAVSSGKASARFSESAYGKRISYRDHRDHLPVRPDRILCPTSGRRLTLAG